MRVFRLELQTGMRYRETGHKTRPFQGNGAGPGTELLTRFKPSNEARQGGAFVMSQARPHRYGIVSICPAEPGAVLTSPTPKTSSGVIAHQIGATDMYRK